jgi:hypothetical protein
MDIKYFETINIKILDNRICLRDLIKQTNNKKFSQNIIEFAKGKTYDNNGHIYVSPKMTIKILNNFKNKHSENILEELKKKNNLETLSLTSDDESDCNSGTLVVAPKNQITEKKNIRNELVFWGHSFTYFIINEKDDEGDINPMVYFSGNEVAEFLEYSDPDQAIRKNVDEDYKKTLEEILKILNLNPVKFTGLKGNWKSALYINKYGLIKLVIKSNKPEAKKFQRYLVEKVIPSILEKGYYATNEIYLINFDTSLIPSILENETLDKYNGYNVIYMIVIGTYKGGFLIKFGITGDLADRLKQHKKTYKPQTTEEGWKSSIKLIYVAITDNNEAVENTFKQLVKSRGLNVELEFEGKNKVELFVTDNVFTVERAKNEMSMLVKTKKTKIEQEKDEYINKIENNYKNMLAIENEKTKQIEIECNRDIKVAEANAKQAEENRKTAEENRKAAEANAKQAEENRKVVEESKQQKQIELEIIKETKNNIKKKDIKKNDNNNNINEENDIYFQFTNERIEETKNEKDKILCVTLYESFISWFVEKYPKEPIPSSKEFNKNIKKYVNIKSKVRVEERVQAGIEGYKLL